MVRPALITARLKSERLKEKILLEINGDSLLKILIQRLKAAFSPVVVCTSYLESDQRLIKEAKDNGAEVFLGHPDDVIRRLTGCAEQWDFEYFLNVTADNPLVDVDVANRLFDKLVNSSQVDFVSAEHCPIGFFSYAVKTSAARKICEVKNKNDTENWHPYFSAVESIKTEKVDVGVANFEDFRFTVDYWDDYNFISQVMDKGKQAGISSSSSMQQILAFLADFPELKKLNADCVQAPEKSIELKMSR